MSSAIHLRDVEVLVLEDDFYLADDAKHTLEDAGARVVGPFADPAEAVSAAGARKPGCALVDINLGGGPNFTAAHALRAMGVPIIFLTGYDTEVIPEDLRDAPCLQKPIEPHRILKAVSSLCGVDGG